MNKLNWDDTAFEIFDSRITDTLDCNDMAITCVEESSDKKRYFVDISWHSYFNQKMEINLVCDTENCNDSLIDNFKTYAEHYNPLGYVEEDINERGIRADLPVVIEHANAIKEKLEKVACQLSGEEYTRKELAVTVTLDEKMLQKLSLLTGLRPEEIEKHNVADVLKKYLENVPEYVYTKDDIKAWGREQLSSLTHGTMKLEVSSCGYDDVLSSETILLAFQEYQNSPDKNSTIFEDFLYNKIYEAWGWESETDLEYDLYEDIKAKAYKEKDNDFQNAFNAFCNEFSGVYDILEQFGCIGSDFDLASYISTYKINLMFATEQERNFDRTSITSSFPSYDEVSITAEHYAENADNMLTHLIYQQGHTLNEVVDCYYNEQYNKSVEDHKGFTETANNSDFVKSVAAEISDEHWAMCELTALTSLSGQNLLDTLNKIARGEGYISLPEGTEIGLFNEWEGGGSNLEINLEKPAVFPCNAITNVQFEAGWYRDCVKSNNGYTVDEVYGLVGSVWTQSNAKITAEAPVLPSLEQMKEDTAKAYSTIKKLATEYKKGKDNIEKE